MGSSIDYGHDCAEDYRRRCRKYGERPPDGDYFNIMSRHYDWLEAREMRGYTGTFEEFCGNVILGSE